MSEQTILSEVKRYIYEAVQQAVSKRLIALKDSEVSENGMPAGFGPAQINLEPPRDKAFGDFACNIAMKLTKAYGVAPVELAKIITGFIKAPMFSKIEVKAPGFINFYLSSDSIYQTAYNILKLNENFGRVNIGNGIKVNVEFGSVNPTGPISVSHGRQVVLGDIFSSMLEFTNHAAAREYYCNDAGNQIRNLGKSVLVRYRQALGVKIDFPEDGYHGDYVMELAKELIAVHGEKYREETPADEEVITLFGDYSQTKMLKEIVGVCEKMGVKYDMIYSERSLYTDGIVEKTQEFLKANGLTYEKDGATWFLATKFDDEKDRVLVKSDGKSTYALSDIAYHKTKYDRGFRQLITFLGADHHGYIKRLHAAVSALGVPAETLTILIHQFVTMLKDGQVVRMSKRAANYVELNELIDDVGVDAVRYFFIMRKMDAHLDFDVNLAKSQSTDNPVFYLQYCHARCHGVLNEAKGRGFETGVEQIAALPMDIVKLLDSPEEVAILKRAADFPKIMEECVRNFSPHLLCHYAEDFVKLFQSFYTKGKIDKNFRIVTDDKNLSNARLFLIYVVLITIRNVLKVLKISTPERM